MMPAVGQGQGSDPCAGADVVVLPEGMRLHRFAEIDSTMVEAARLARETGIGGHVVWADIQTAGRGRRGTAWLSPPGNLHVSVVLDPTGPPAAAARLAFSAALAMAEAVSAVLADRGPVVQVKWPNDVLLGGGKVAGILLESVAVAGRPGLVVVGMGLNVARKPPRELTGYATAALADHGPPPRTGAVLTILLDRLQTWARTLATHGFGPLRDAWLARAAGLGDPIRVRSGTGPERTGRFAGLDEDGALLLGPAAGSGLPERVLAGEVFLTGVGSNGEAGHAAGN